MRYFCFMSSYGIGISILPPKLCLYTICLFSHRCCCGQSRQTHPTIPGIEAGSPGDVWLPNKHTRSHPTDAYGTIEFQGGAHPTKAQVNDQLFNGMQTAFIQRTLQQKHQHYAKRFVCVIHAVGI